eukprot:jgi/Ulvmu1/5954/UM026_0076.1
MASGSSEMLPQSPREDGRTEIVVPTSALRQVDAISDHGEKLSTLLESHCMSIRRNMMDFYREARSSFLESQSQAVETERRTCASQLHDKHVELDRTRGELESTYSRNADVESFLLSSCGLVSELNQRIRLRRLLATQFKDWRAVAAWRKRERGLQKQADNWYTKEILQRRVLKRWWFNASVYMKVEARKGLGMVRGLQDQIAQQQAAMNSLQMQLVEARRALVAEKQGRDMLAQDMKRSFMRGVCALNLEAMQVMKRGVVPGAQHEGKIEGVEQSAHDNLGADGVPNPRENLPENIQNMMSALNITTGPTNPAQAPMLPTMKQGNPMSGLAVKER